MRGTTLAGRCDSQRHGNAAGLPRVLDPHRSSEGPGHPPDVRVPGPAHDNGPVGLNPFRQHRRSPADIFMVAGALLVCVALVAWAVLG